MINYELPEDISPKMGFLRELYNYSQLIGALLYTSERLFHDAFRSSCEFIKSIVDQDEELAYYQWLASIEALYKEEYERLNMDKLGEYIEGYLVKR